MKVFDISDYQDEKRVETLVEKGAEGVLIKLGEMINGEHFRDTLAYHFVTEADMYNIPFGLYYVSDAISPDGFMCEAQRINNELYQMLGTRFPELGLWWDMEKPRVCRPGVWPQLRDIIGTQEAWYPAHKGKIGIYAQYSYFYDYIDFDELVYYGIPVWVAQYYHENSLKTEHPELNHVAWQFTTHGETQDENVWYGF